jgi:hypothetical protein
VEIFWTPSGVQEFETPKDRHVERRRDVKRRMMNFPLTHVLNEDRVLFLD